MITETLVSLSRAQFALTSMYHFLFVPLTLGLSFLLVCMEASYLVTGKEIYRDMTRFWGKLFGVNFAIGVASGITMEFQFGTNWAYYSHYVGDIFGAPLAIEGLMAFFLESTFIGLFFFGWNRLSKAGHFVVTCLMALGSNLSALWILVANAWMQYPTGAAFNFQTMRMEMTDFFDVIFSPWALAKFGHTIAAGYMTGAMLVLAVSAWYLLKGRNVAFAKRSFRLAAAFGLVAGLMTVHMGDESGVLVARDQPTKIATMEAIWQTQPAPAPMMLFGIHDQANLQSTSAVEIPWVGGIIATRSLSTPIKGIREILEENRLRIENGVLAVQALAKLRENPSDANLRADFAEKEKDLGYGLLLRRYVSDVSQASSEDVEKAALDTVPNVSTMFWSFRIMVGCAVTLLLVFLFAFVFSVRNSIVVRRRFLRLTIACLPLPWVACELGWVVAEYGRQPWSIWEILPVHLSTSSVSAANVATTIGGFALLYTALLAVELWLFLRIVRTGPSFLGLGRYFYERNTKEDAK